MVGFQHKKSLLIPFLAILCISSVTDTFAQFAIKGKVVDAETMEPLQFATVFVNNSSFGGVTDQNGFYEFNIPAGNHELIISYIGYQPFSYTFSTDLLRDFYEFQILQEPIVLAEYGVTEKRDKVWFENLKAFEVLFLGNSVNASQCKILNPEVLILDTESDSAKLTVRAGEILEIENPNLGYTIKYVLSHFEYMYSEKTIVYAGYPFFIEKQFLRRRQKRIDLNREKAYLGSVTHFLSCLFNGTSISEGYALYETTKVLNQESFFNEETENLKFLKKDTKTSTKDGFLMGKLNKGISPDSIYLPYKSPMDPSKLIQESVDGRKFITYDRPIYIVYKQETVEPGSTAYSLQNLSWSLKTLGLDAETDPTHTLELPQLSLMEMKSKAVQIFENGSYFHPIDLFFEGYMAWEKIGDLMPLDYGSK